MTFLSSNIKFLRKKNGLTQKQFAEKLGITRSLVGSYEEKRAEPKLMLLQQIAHFFNITTDQLISHDFSSQELPDDTNLEYISGKKLRILNIVSDQKNKEQITVVPVKAAAGYAKGYADAEFVETLPKFSLPLPELSKERSYRLFQIQGESMNPVPSGAYIISEYIQNWQNVKDGKTYIIITENDGVIYKRVFKKEQFLLLRSDNPDFQPYSIPLKNVCEIWFALGYITFQLPETKNIF